MKPLILIILTFFYFSSVSQNAFELLIKTEENESLSDLTELSNGDIIMVGGIGKSAIFGASESSQIIKINSVGEIKKKINVNYPDSAVRLYSVLKTDDENIIVLGTTADLHLGYSNTILYQKYDNELNLIAEKRLKTPKESIYTSIMITKKTSKNSLIVAGYTTQNPYTERDYDMFFYEISQNGDSINSSFYISEERNFNIATDIIEKQDSSGYYSIVMFYPFFDYSAPGQILNMDNNFNVLTFNNLPDRLYSNGNIAWINDSSLLICNIIEIENKIGTRIIDTMTNIISTHNYGNESIVSIPGIFKSIYHKKNDDYIYFCGTSNFDITNFYSQRKSHIIFIKTDKHLNPVWEMFYKGDAYYRTNAFTRTIDKGFIFLASRYDYTSQNNENDIFILKVDEFGNMPVNIEKNTIEQVELIIYPNPGSDILQIRTAVQQQGGEFNMYDLSGKQIIQERINSSITQINTSNLKTGIYIFKYINKGKIIESGKWLKK